MLEWTLEVTSAMTALTFLSCAAIHVSRAQVAGLSPGQGAGSPNAVVHRASASGLGPVRREVVPGVWVFCDEWAPGRVRGTVLVTEGTSVEVVPDRVGCVWGEEELRFRVRVVR